MHVLLTNDDGISAPGLQALENAMQQLGWNYTIVAPATEQSQCGHRVTTHQHLKVETLGENRHAVHGTPADCVRLALFALDLKPDLVLSGVNAGGNMGQDIVISGTVAAAREAAYHGFRSMALSHYLIRELTVDWQRTAAWMAEIVRRRTPKTTRKAPSGTSIFPICQRIRAPCRHASSASRHGRLSM
ncbi:MAG: 5'/3'-nucleotidase SurE [Prosthecobacter sp.]|uniref:5'/3'-nucleotidase SurE n=1 Tax=Prosthecobacter sp. TaxID=1965333 RepID=UPI003BB0BDE3